MFADYPVMICRVNVTYYFLYIQLFHFDVHEDVRTTADATIEKDEVHFLPSGCGYYFKTFGYKDREMSFGV